MAFIRANTLQVERCSATRKFWIAWLDFQRPIVDEISSAIERTPALNYRQTAPAGIS